jgi:hypothetical protein
MMKIAVSGVLLLATGLPPLRAEEFPWCVKMDAFTKNCAFSDYNECATIAKNAEAVCIRNPDYKPPVAAAAPSKPRKTANPQR